MARSENKINKIIGIANGDIIAVNEYFKYDDDDMEGYTGTRFQPHSAKEVRFMNSNAYAKEYIESCYSKEEIKKHFGSMKKAILQLKNETYSDFIGQDDSYVNTFWEQFEKYTKDFKKIFGFNPKTYSCSGCGRMFGGSSGINKDTKWDILYEPEMLNTILELELNQ
mgnify:CR=1 FL=1